MEAEGVRGGGQASELLSYLGGEDEFPWRVGIDEARLLCGVLVPGRAVLDVLDAKGSALIHNLHLQRPDALVELVPKAFQRRVRLLADGEGVLARPAEFDGPKAGFARPAEAGGALRRHGRAVLLPLLPFQEEHEFVLRGGAFAVSEALLHLGGIAGRLRLVAVYKNHALAGCLLAVIAHQEGLYVGGEPLFLLVPCHLHLHLVAPPVIADSRCLAGNFPNVVDEGPRSRGLQRPKAQRSVRVVLRLAHLLAIFVQKLEGELFRLQGHALQPFRGGDLIFRPPAVGNDERLVRLRDLFSRDGQDPGGIAAHILALLHLHSRTRGGRAVQQVPLAGARFHNHIDLVPEQALHLGLAIFVGRDRL